LSEKQAEEEKECREGRKDYNEYFKSHKVEAIVASSSA